MNFFSNPFLLILNLNFKALLKKKKKLTYIYIFFLLFFFFFYNVLKFIYMYVSLFIEDSKND